MLVAPEATSTLGASLAGYALLRRTSGSATSYEGNCTLSESRENRPGRPRSRRVGDETAPLRYGRRSGGCTAAAVVEKSIQRIGGACQTIRL